MDSNDPWGHNTSFKPSGIQTVLSLTLKIFNSIWMLRSQNRFHLLYRSWDLYTTGQLVDGLQQKKKKKKETRFSLNGNGIMSSFLGR